MSSTPIVYIDTNVFAYRLLNNPNYGNLKAQSLRFFDDVDDGKYLGVTSTFTRIEYIGIIKKIISYVKKRALTVQEEQEALTDFQELLDGLAINLNDADMLSYDNISNGYTIFHDTSEVIGTANPHFDSKATEKKKWKSIGGTDALQISLAIRSGAERFATFDKAFKGLSNSSIVPLIISEEYVNVNA